MRNEIQLTTWAGGTGPHPNLIEIIMETPIHLEPATVEMTDCGYFYEVNSVNAIRLVNEVSDYFRQFGEHYYSGYKLRLPKKLESIYFAKIVAKGYKCKISEQNGETEKKTV